MRKNHTDIVGPAFALAAGLLAMTAVPASAGQGAITAAATAAERAPCGTYTVKAGDTLGDIALRETGDRATTDIIFRMNAGMLESADEIRPGMVLTMPCGTDLASVMARSGGDSAHAVAAAWTAEAGDFLVPVLVEWGTKAGYDVIVEHNSDWRFGVPYSHGGKFRAAIDDVISGFATAAVPPVVVFYTNNVMTIGVR